MELPKVQFKLTAGLAVTILAAFVALCGGRAGAKVEVSDFLPIGALEAAPQDQDSQADLMVALASVVASQEDAVREFDARFEVTTETPADSYERTIARISKRPLPPGTHIVFRAKEVLVGPLKRNTRWAKNGSIARHESRMDCDPSLIQSQSPQHADGVYDGANYYRYFPKDNTGSASSIPNSTVMKAYEPWLTLTNIDGVSLTEFLGSPGARYEGQQSVGDTYCIKVSAARGGRAYEIWVSPQNGYRAMRAVRSREGFLVITEVSSFRDCGKGRWFPESGRHVAFTIDGSQEPAWQSHVTWRLTSYRDSADDEVFAAPFPSGTEVTDTTSGSPVTFVVP